VIPIFNPPYVAPPYNPPPMFSHYSPPSNAKTSRSSRRKAAPSTASSEREWKTATDYGSTSSSDDAPHQSNRSHAPYAPPPSHPLPSSSRPHKARAATLPTTYPVRATPFEPPAELEYDTSTSDFENLRTHRRRSNRPCIPTSSSPPPRENMGSGKTEERGGGREHGESRHAARGSPRMPTTYPIRATPFEPPAELEYDTLTSDFENLGTHRRRSDHPHVHPPPHDHMRAGIRREHEGYKEKGGRDFGQRRANTSVY